MSDSIDYMRGQREGFARILNLINTYDTKMIDKADLYRKILELEPLPFLTQAELDETSHRED